MVSQTRPLVTYLITHLDDSVEEILRKQVLRIPNLTVVCGIVEGLIPSADRKRIDAVNVRLAEATELSRIPCDLFLDCSGPACGAVKWLERAGWSKVNRIAYGQIHSLVISLQFSDLYIPDPKVMYNSAFVPINEHLQRTLPLFEHPEYAGGFSKLAFIRALIPGPKDNRMVVGYRVEGDKCMYFTTPTARELTNKLFSFGDAGSMGRQARNIADNFEQFCCTNGGDLSLICRRRELYHGQHEISCQVNRRGWDQSRIP